MAEEILHPSIYYFHPLLAGQLSAWEGHLDRVKALGFDHVLLAPCFKPGRSGDLFLTADHDRLHPMLGSQSAKAGLHKYIQSCRDRDLVPCLDLVIDRFDANAVIVRQHPNWFDIIAPSPRDPRRFSLPQSAAFCRFDDPPSALMDWWQRRLQHWLELGIAVFRCLHPSGVPQEVWRVFIGGAKALYSNALFAADSAPGRESIGEAGFDYSLAAPWPSPNSPLPPSNQADGAADVQSIAVTERPFGPRLAQRFSTLDQLARGYRQAIQVTAIQAAGWLLPMGTEVACAKRLSPSRANPALFAASLQHPQIDLSNDIIAANARRRRQPTLRTTPHWQTLSAPGAPVEAALTNGHISELSGMSVKPIARRANGQFASNPGTQQRLLRLVNTDLGHRQRCHPIRLLARSGGTWIPSVDTNALTDGHEHQHNNLASLELDMGEIRFLDVFSLPPVAAATRRTAQSAADSSMLCIESLVPQIDNGHYPVKRILGEPIDVSADIFSEGHGVIAAALLWRANNEKTWNEVPMRHLGNDRWSALFEPPRIGRHQFTIEAWRDDFASFQSDVAKKHAAGQSLQLELMEAQLFLAPTADDNPDYATQLTDLRLAYAAADDTEKLKILLAGETSSLVAALGRKQSLLRYAPAVMVDIERRKAGFSSWYELFPRSQSGDIHRHGTFEDVIAHLPMIRAMGFDTLYFPPIHPIGRVNRKGRNNAITAEPGDPGSPYAIGSSEGGHDALHPELGTLADFQRLREAAAEQGLELALDFAIQCAPDHPWLREHPEWFAWRPDGSLKYAENPPKKYEDIVNVDFHAPAAIPGLWAALRDVILFWCHEGIRTFRVDNPHTKPLPFWEWLIEDIRGRYPDVIFLSEAFTRPKLMYRLAKIGFSQSYTYFTWRNTKAELQSYLTELTEGPPKAFFRPHFFVNTPDINPFFLQVSGRAGFLIRAALATTLSGLWGMYNGFELCEAAALPGKEEYLDSEKYQLRCWDLNRPGNIVREITQLNLLRQRHPALQSHLGLRFLNAFNDHVLYFRKATPDRDNVILVAINLDPFHAQECDIEIPLWEWGIDDAGAIAATDLLSGTDIVWHGKIQHIRLDPTTTPYGIWHLRRLGGYR